MLRDSDGDLLFYAYMRCYGEILQPHPQAWLDMKQKLITRCCFAPTSWVKLDMVCSMHAGCTLDHDVDSL